MGEKETPHEHRRKEVTDSQHLVFKDPTGKWRFEARRFDPRHLSEVFDPNARLFERPVDVPYFNVPLWDPDERLQRYGKRLLGYIAGDNKNSRARITKLQLEAFDLIAAIAAPTLARHWGK
jgi:hypothetical protein